MMQPLQGSFVALVTPMSPDGSIDFNTSYIHDNQNIADIKIEFYKEEVE